MFSMRNVGGVALFLFGTTFMWLTPAFASKGVSTKGVWWSTTNLVSLAAVGLFTAATWGLFKRADWWEGVAIVAAILGVLVLIPYWVAAGHAEETTRAWNVFVHVVGDAGVLLLLLVPTFERWVNGHVIAGR